MEKIEKIYNEFKQYKIPQNELEILKYIMNGDEKATENFQLIRRFVASSLHVDVHLSQILTEMYGIHSDGFSHVGEKFPILNEKGNFEMTTILNSTDGLNAEKSTLANFLKGDFEKWEKLIDFIDTYYEPQLISTPDFYKMVKKQTEMVEGFYSDWKEDFENLEKKRKLEQQKELLQAELKPQKKSEVEKAPGEMQAMIQLPPPAKNFVQQFFRNRKIKKELLQPLNQKLAELDAKNLTEDGLRQKMVEGFQAQEELYQTRFGKRQIEKMKLLMQNDVSIDMVLREFEEIKDLGEFLSTAFIEDIGKFIKDVKGNMQIAQEMYSPELLKSETLSQMVSGIRTILKNKEIHCDREITEQYRNGPLKSNQFIKGANFSRNQIEEEMKKLETEYSDAIACENPEEYVRRCADIHLKFLMIHPFSDGNGRTAKILLSTMLAQKDLIMPALIDTYYDRIQGCQVSEYMEAGDRAAIYGDYGVFQDYLIRRVQAFNPGAIELTTIESIRNLGKDVKIEDKIALTPLISKSQNQIENEKKGERSE